MLKIYRVLGKKGRITIPYEIRQRIGFRYNDVLSFIQQDDGSVLVRREKICDNCNEFAEEFEENFTLEDFLDSLSEEERGCRINALKKKNRVARKGCPVSAFYSII